MLRLMRNGVCRFSGMVGAVIAVAGFAALQVFGQAAPPAGQLRQIDPSEHLFKLGFKFQGAGTCANANCHGAPLGGAPAGGKYINPSYTQWAAEATPEAPADPHRVSFRTLRKPASAEMGKKLGIANVAAAAQCVSCHALGVPENLKEQGLTIAEGVTCNACHGPSGASVANPADKGWNIAHQTAGWAKGQRAAHVGKHGDLLKKTGFYDTKLLVE